MCMVPGNLCTCVQPSVPIATNVQSTSINLHTLKLALNLNSQASFTVTMIVMARSEAFVWRRYHDQTCIDWLRLGQVSSSAIQSTVTMPDLSFSMRLPGSPYKIPVSPSQVTQFWTRWITWACCPIKELSVGSNSNMFGFNAFFLACSASNRLFVQSVPVHLCSVFLMNDPTEFRHPALPFWNNWTTYTVVVGNSIIVSNNNYRYLAYMDVPVSSYVVVLSPVTMSSNKKCLFPPLTHVDSSSSEITWLILLLTIMPVKEGFFLHSCSRTATSQLDLSHLDCRRKNYLVSQQYFVQSYFIALID